MDLFDRHCLLHDIPNYYGDVGLSQNECGVNDRRYFAALRLEVLQLCDGVEAG
ncbi:hypothetical protein D3C71_2092080 [compost metagenome]